MRDPGLADLLDLAWSRLETGSGREVALATLGRDGPEVRTLILRAAEREGGTVDVHTDAAAAKVAQLSADPRAALVLWDADASLQIQVRGSVEVVTGAGADAAWERVPEDARHHYGGEPEPGRPIAGPDAYRPGAERGRFAILRLRIETMEALRLGEPDLRAVFRRGDGFAGEWLAP